MKVITKICPLTGQEHGMEFTDEVAERIHAWETARAEGRPHGFVQVEFSDLSPDEREFILTGAHPKAFDEAFGGEEEY